MVRGTWQSMRRSRGCDGGEAPPTLRLYTWQPWCLSLGYFQRAGRSADREELARRGWTLVRCPTGGCGVLHADELTYSIIAPASLLAEFEGSGVTQTYLAISRGLAEGCDLPVCRARSR